MAIDWHCKFSKIYVIESLPEGEHKTGKELFDDYLLYGGMELEFQEEKNGLKRKLQREYIDAKTRADFFAALEKVLAETNECGVGPIIHLEMHGYKHGVILSSGESVDWKETRERFLDIHVACECNLFITLAVCEGADLYMAVDIRSRCPFWGLLGSIQKISTATVAQGFGEYYRIFLTEMNARKAFNALNAISGNAGTYFSLVNTQNLFAYSFKNAFSQKGISRVVDGILDELPKKIRKEYVQKYGKHGIRPYIKQSILTDKLKQKYLDEWQSNFFLWDIFPQNRERFSLTVEEIREMPSDMHFLW